MLTLEQVRALNDGLARGDWNAALQPLEEQIDLRHAELPKLEKKSLAALVEGLQTPETATFWAKNVFAPNISVRRFVRRTFLGLKEGAMPLGAPLQAALENFWATETPLQYSFNAREAAARREQVEIVENALEILLRVEPKRFMQFWVSLNEVARPAKERRQEENEVWYQQQRNYGTAYEAATKEVLTALFGEDIVTSDRRWQLPTRVWNEVRAEVDNRPEIKSLLEAMGNNPWATAALEWQPEQLFQAAMAPYMSQNATGPQRKIAAEIREFLWGMVDAAFDEKLCEAERANAGLQLRELMPGHRMNVWLDREQMWERLPALLEQQRPDVTQMTPKEAEKSAWFGLAQALAFSLQRPYYSDAKEWNPPAEITPPVLRSWKIAEEEAYGVNYHFENAARGLEEASKQATVDNLDSDSENVIDQNDLGLEDILEDEFEKLHLGFFPTEWDKAQKEAEQTGEQFGDIIDRWREQKLQEIRAIKTTTARAETLINPPLYIDLPLPRTSLWYAWSKQDSDLKEQLWPLVSERLWTLYEEKLEAYRRVETDEIAPQLGEKLTERELKEWKSSQRAQKRGQISAEINGLNELISTAEGLDGELKMLSLLERPGVRELKNAQLRQILGHATDSSMIHQNMLEYVPSFDGQWLRDNWFLDARWETILAQLEPALLGAKRLNEWEKVSLQQQFAVAYYRLKTPEGRQKFLELAPEVDNLAGDLCVPVTVLRDVETWLLILDRLEWSYEPMRELWNQIRAQNDEQSRELTRNVLQRLSISNRERSAKIHIELLNDVSVEELTQNADLIENALESSLIPVKRWSLATLTKIGKRDSNIAQLVAEMLWSENSALVKESIKFLGTQSGEEVELAWDSLQDVLTLENQPTLELALRSLVSLKTKNAELELNESARERITELSELAPTRFEKFGKKLL